MKGLPIAFVAICIGVLIGMVCEQGCALMSHTMEIDPEYIDYAVRAEFADSATVVKKLKNGNVIIKFHYSEDE